MSWIDDYKGAGPWPFIEQKDKFGYLNNPRWSNSPKGAADPISATEFCEIIGLSTDREIHKPCGHWHKGSGSKYEKTSYLIAFEAYDSDGNQIGYIVCYDGLLGNRRLVLTDNVINPHPIYPFNRDLGSHNPYAPDGYEDWNDWYETEQAAYAEPNNLVYPFHFPDWKLCTGWCEWDGFFRDHTNPDDYLDMANPYPLTELEYPHDSKPPDKCLWEETEGDITRTFYDLSQHTKYEEKLMTWIPEDQAMGWGYEGAEDAFDEYDTGTNLYPGAETPICCNYYDWRYDWEYENNPALLWDADGVGLIYGAKRRNRIVTRNIDSALTGVTVTEKDQACKTYESGEID